MDGDKYMNVKEKRLEVAQSDRTEQVMVGRRNEAAMSVGTLGRLVP